MLGCQRLLFLTFLVSTLSLTRINALPDFEPKRIPETDAPKFVVIKEDVIPDVENTTQKVIRVNPLDFAPINDNDNDVKKMDSSLYKIQSLIPATARIRPTMKRKYINSNRMRQPRPLRPRLGVDDGIDDNNDDANDGHISILQNKLTEPKIRKPKKKQLHFLYDQPTLEGDRQAVSKSMPVHVAPGAYPVYYVVAKTNGRFGKYPIKGFRTPTEFMKYLLKTKSESIDLAQRKKISNLKE